MDITHVNRIVDKLDDIHTELQKLIIALAPTKKPTKSKPAKKATKPRKKKVTDDS